MLFENPDTRRTFRNEVWRSLPAGIIDTLASTFGMLIAVRVYHMPDWAKVVFLTSTSSGLITSLFIVPLLLKARSTIAKTAAKVQFLAGGFMALSALFHHSPTVYIIGLSLGLFCFSMQIPLMTQIYRMNYPEAVRGRLFALSGVTRAAMAVAFGFLGGWLLGVQLDHYVWLLWAFALSGFISGYWTYGLPSTNWEQDATKAAAATATDSASAGGTRLWSALRWLKIDKGFRTLLISWMIMGIGNLAAGSLFVEYLANPAHGIHLEEAHIAWITGVIPMLFRMAAVYPWGLIYDRVGLFTVRAVLNVVFAASILCFYLGHGTLWWTLGMMLWGIATAGGNVTWGLWVTKLAPKHAVAEYMSVHTFLTGLRGLISPYLAFAAIHHFSFQTIALACSALILAASAFITVRARSSDEETTRRMGPGERL